MREREQVSVASPVGGWPPPWPSVAEVASALSSEHWTLVGGLMVQMHALRHGVDAVRPTNDIDILVHVETGSGRPAKVAAALASLGYELQPSIDARRRTAHRLCALGRPSTFSSQTTPHPGSASHSEDTEWSRSRAAPKPSARRWS